MLLNTALDVGACLGLQCIWGKPVFPRIGLRGERNGKSGGEHAIRMGIIQSIFGSCKILHYLLNLFAGCVPAVHGDPSRELGAAALGSAEGCKRSASSRSPPGDSAVATEHCCLSRAPAQGCVMTEKGIWLQPRGRREFDPRPALGWRWWGCGTQRPAGSVRGACSRLCLAAAAWGSGSWGHSSEGVSVTPKAAAYTWYDRKTVMFLVAHVMKITEG